MSKKRRVILVGWDAADWKVARPLMEKGEMPNLARLVSGGSSGNIGTLQPPLSPMLWTSIATGKRPPKHGIHGFSEPTPNGMGTQPVSILSRTTKAFWNILNQNGIRTSIAGWWPSHPAEPLKGVMISNHFQKTGTAPKSRPILPGSIHPLEWVDRLAELRITPMELPGDVIRLFVPDYDRINQDKDKRLHTMATIIAETMNIHAAATEVLEHAEWDFAAVYYDSIDHFCHGFMDMHPPRLPWVKQADFDLYNQVINTAYRYHDQMLGRLLQLAGPDTTVIVMSDHGFHPDGLRRGYIPAEAAGPALEHRSFGMLTINGPGIKANNTIYGANLLDIAPTILHLYGIPVGADMDGKVLVTILDNPGTVEAIPTWDSVEGESGTHPPGARLDPVASAEAMKQMVALGYVAPPGPDAARNVSECVIELKYNLARAHDDAGQADRSVPLYEALHAEDPADHRFAERLIGALTETGQQVRAVEVLDAFDRTCDKTAPEAKLGLERRRELKPDNKLDATDNPEDQRDQHERRMLAERATGYVLLRQMLRLHLDLACDKDEDARRQLEKVEKLAADGMQLPPIFIAQSYMRIGEEKKALVWVERALKRDPDEWQALGLAARIHIRARRFSSALDAAAASLALIYFQPIMHHVMGRALAAMGESEGAERSFKVALTQMPGLSNVHGSLARLYKRQGRTSDADFHRARSAELRRQLVGDKKPRVAAATIKPIAIPAREGPRPAQPATEIVVVAGLPRSGTSMLMQLLVAGGLQPLTDGRRKADSDNPKGYYEFEQATHLAHDKSWLPMARGKVVKLALPLVHHLPHGESYRVILIERDPRDVIASQKVMLARLGRTAQGTSLDDDALAAEYARQREIFRGWLDARPEVAILPVQYEQILADPHATAARIGAFLGRDFDVIASVIAVVPALRRQFVAQG